MTFQSRTGHDGEPVQDDQPALRPASSPRSFRTPRTILALLMREMQTTYGRSPGGYVWAIVEPIGAIALFTFVISTGLRVRNPSIGTNFALFYATGFLPYIMVIQTAGKVSGAIQFSRPLLFYPGVKYTDTLIARFLLDALTKVMVFFILMTGIHIVFGLSTIRNEAAIAGAILMSLLVGLGIGTLNCFLFAVWAPWQSAWRIITRPLLLISTVLFALEDVPSEYHHAMLWNPIVHTVGLMRRGFYATYDATYVSPVYVVSVGLICLTLGLLPLRRHHKDLINA
jgi:capsular polysaccharide transport system permease protein